MPELPELEVIREFLAPRLVGVSIATAQVRRPLIVRNLLDGDPSGSIPSGQSLADHLVGQALP